MSNVSNSMSNKQSVLAQKKPCPYKEEQDLKKISLSSCLLFLYFLLQLNQFKQQAHINSIIHSFHFSRINT